MRDGEQQKARSESLVWQRPWAMSSFSATTPSEEPPPHRRPETSLGSHLSSSPYFSGPCHSTAQRRSSKACLGYTCALHHPRDYLSDCQPTSGRSPDCSPAPLSSYTALSTASRYTSHFCFHCSEASAPLILLGT